MARHYRLQGEGFVYHIISRGDNRKKIFINNFDYDKFFEYLKIAKEKFKFYLYAYCLMSNHYHLLLETPLANISRIMQYLNTCYTVYYNIKRDNCGHLFQGRYKSIIVDKDNYLLELTRYIHLNPVRANIVEDPANYKWNSYGEYISENKINLIDKNQIYKYFQIEPEVYRDFVLKNLKKNYSPFKDLYLKSILGKEEFVKKILNIFKKQAKAKEFAYKHTILKRVNPEDVIDIIAKYFNKTPEQLCKSKKRPMTIKKLTIYLLRQKTDLTNTQIGEFFNMTSTAVSKAMLDFERQLKENKIFVKEIKEITSKVEV